MADNATNATNAADATIDALANRYEAYRSVVDELTEQLNTAKADRDAAERDLIMTILAREEELGVEDLRIRVDNRNYSVRVKEYFSIPSEEREAAFPLLRELGHGDLIVEKVDDRTLSKELQLVIEQSHESGSAEEFPAEYEPLLAHLKRYTKPSLSRTLAR